MRTRPDGQIALVTGANRGIGLEVCRQLAEMGASILLASRDVRKGERAIAKLGANQSNVKAIPLDVTDSGSIAAVARLVTDECGRLDILVNNAGVSLNGFNETVVRQTLAVNFFGALHVTDALRPIMRQDGRIVMVSSGMGELSAFSGPVRERLSDPALTRDALIALMQSFENAVGSRAHAARGWPSSAYRASKAGLNALTRVLAREPGNAALRINAVSPGWVRTDMGGRSAPRSIEIGGASVVWAATLMRNGPTGGLFQDGERMDW